ncbi:MAG TPA: hypothetical protein PKE69_27340, partial [Pyrinomonadaceae bacterium]|nr:hypothetical protein [Pyrinomonadaceae bacterium]
MKANDPRIIDSINKELAKTQATLKGLGKTALFDDTNIRASLNALNEAQLKAAALKNTLTGKNVDKLDVTQKADVSLNLSSAINEVERLKTEIKSINALDLENSIRGSLNEFTELNDETR